MPNLSISKSRRSTSNHSRRSCGGGRNNNNRRTQGGKKKQQDNHNGASVVSSTSSSTAAAIAPYIPKPLSDMRTNFLQKFERLSSLIDDTLENDEGIVPINLCADIRDGWMDEKQDEVADDAKPMFDDATFVLGSIEEQTNKVCSKNYYQADGIQDVSTDLTAVNTSDERSLDNRVDDNNNPSKRSEVRQRQTPSNTNDAVNKSEEAAAAVSKTCTDFTTAASEFNKTGEQRCNFASWLASQEFDASAIVWNGDDNNPQELNTVIEGGGGLNHNEVASIGIMQQQPRTIGRSRSCEYSRDEFENHIEQDYKNELPKKEEEEQDNNNEDKDGGDDDGYVSIADVTGSKWTNKLKEMGVNNVWEKVTTCTMSSPTSCVQDVDWKCWEGKTPLGKKVNTAKYLFPKSTPGNAMNQPSILKNDSSFVLDNMEGSPSSNGCQTIHQKSISNGIAEKNKSSAAETNCGAYIGTASLTADGSLLEDKAKNLAVDADQKKPSPTSDIPSSSKDQEDEGIIKKLGLVPCETPSSSNMPLQPKNLHDSLFSNTSSHVSSLTDRVTTKSGGGQATDSSVATPLLAGEDLLDGGGSIIDAFATPARFDDCHVPSDANTPGGIDSCTYSVSPTHHPFSGKIETTAQPAAHMSSELTPITERQYQSQLIRLKLLRSHLIMVHSHNNNKS